MLVFGGIATSLVSIFLTLGRRDVSDFRMSTDRILYILRNWRHLLMYCAIIDQAALSINLIFFIVIGEVKAYLKVMSFSLFLGSSFIFLGLIIRAFIQGYQEYKIKLTTQPMEIIEGS